MTTTAEEPQDLPWWTEEELQAVSAIDDFILATGEYDIPVTPWQLPLRLKSRDANIGIKWNYYKADVLDKYRNNRYCDIGYDYESKSHYIRFLNTDSSKPADSLVRFRFTNDVVMAKVADTINIPPRQLSYWNQYKQ